MLPPPAPRLLAAGAEAADRSPKWPAASWDALRAAGVLGWSIPSEYGGAGRPTVDLFRLSESIASHCLTTAFALSQREAAVRQLLKGPEHLRALYLPKLAAGEQFLTVGLSQLTTSRRHTAPALSAMPDGNGYRLDGDIPWVTGADRAAALIVGATLPNGEEIVAAVPSDRNGLTVAAPMELSALAGSRTAAVRCDGVKIGPDQIVAGPKEQVLGPSGGGGLETTVLALGLASAAVGLIHDEAAKRLDLAGPARSLGDAVDVLRGRLLAAADAPPEPARTLALRVDGTRLALRATQAALVSAKGAGFLAGHPAQRWARQALFFLVWSCPRPVSEGLMGELASPAE